LGAVLRRPDDRAIGRGNQLIDQMGRVPRDADEEEWTLRFLTDGLSPKVADLRRVGSVSVIFQHDPDDAFVALAGTASVAEGKPEIRRRWKAAYDAYFPDGPESQRQNHIALPCALVPTRLTAVSFPKRCPAISKAFMVLS
jgi:Pyridoxamine 5'-phosphate oxidase like